MSRKSSVYVWSLESAIAHLKNTHLTCRVCGQQVPCWPLDAHLWHILTHAHGQERKKIEELLVSLETGKGMPSLKECLAAQFSKPEFVEYAVKHGILVEVKGEDFE